MTVSTNNRLILEQYVKEGLKAKIQGGIATPNQKDGVKGLRVLMEAQLANGIVIPTGSVAYIREEVLHNHAWASKSLTCDTIPEKFIIAESTFVEFYDFPVSEPVA